MQVKSTNKILRSRERRVAKSSFLNSWERPRALATAVATPILSRSCMRRNSRSTALFFHDLRRNAADFVAICALSGPGGSKPCYRESADVHWRFFAGDNVGHDPGRDRRQKDAVAKMSCGGKNAGNIRPPQDWQIIRRARPQTGPALDDRGRLQPGQVPCRSGEQLVNG